MVLIFYELRDPNSSFQASSSDKVAGVTEGLMIEMADSKSLKTVYNLKERDNGNLSNYLIKIGLISFGFMDWIWEGDNSKKKQKTMSNEIKVKL